MKNLISGIASRLIVLLLGFGVRTVFIWQLGNVYLSIDGLYSNILGMLSLAELGFGTAIVYSMYEPLSKNDSSKLAALLQLYRKVYFIIGIIIYALGLCLIPFMHYLIKNPPDIPYLTFYYWLFLTNSSVSYWFVGYKRSILIADQKEYICTTIHSELNIVKSALQIIILILFHNFTLYLFIQLFATIAENLLIAKKTNKQYPDLKKASPYILSREERNRIARDVRSLAVTRVGHVALNSTDNIIISAFIGVSWVGLLSNYSMITEALVGVLCLFTGAITASLGNYFAEKVPEECYSMFERIEFANSWLYGICSIALITLLNPFIALWLGEGFLLDSAVVVAIVINFFVQGYMNTLWTFRSTLGLFSQGWYRPLLVAFLNIFLSVLLGKIYGVFGVLIATSISRAAVNMWFDPLIIHKYGFHRSVKQFFTSYLRRFGEIGIILALVLCVKQLILRNGVTLISFFVLSVFTAALTLSLFYLMNRKKEEYQYFKNILFNKILHRG